MLLSKQKLIHEREEKCEQEISKIIPFVSSLVQALRLILSKCFLLAKILSITLPN